MSSDSKNVTKESDQTEQTVEAPNEKIKNTWPWAWLLPVMVIKLHVGCLGEGP